MSEPAKNIKDYGEGRARYCLDCQSAVREDGSHYQYTECVKSHIAQLQSTLDRLENALQEVADCKDFDAFDPTDCTEEIYETGNAMVETARDALSS